MHAGLSQIKSADIERVQKAACSVILGKLYRSFKTALSTLGLDGLDERREALSSNFTKKAFKSEKYVNWFVKDTNISDKRREVKTVKEAHCRTKRLNKSALPYLINILNALPKKIP